MYSHAAELIFEQNRQLMISVKEVKRRQRRRVRSLLHKIWSVNARILMSSRKKNHRWVAKSFYCIICSKDFSNQSKFARHLRTHTGEKPYQCILCLKMFGTKYHLRRHHSIHQRPFKCGHCTKTFASKRLLTKHLNKTHLRCSHCLKVFAKKSELQKHIKLVKGVRRPQVFSCDFCYKTFVRKFHLQRHVRVHTHEKPFKCSWCSRAFSRKDNLSKHVVLHTGQNVQMDLLSSQTGRYSSRSIRFEMFARSRELFAS